jgi:hypothetical protein
MARDFLAIPAAGAGVERTFNISRDFVSYRRHNLKGPTVRLLMLTMAIDKFNLRESYKSIQMSEEWESPNPDEDDDQDELAGEANYISDDEENSQDGASDEDNENEDALMEDAQESEKNSDNDYDISTEEDDSDDDDDSSDNNDEATRPKKRTKYHHTVDRSQQSLRPYLTSAPEKTDDSQHPYLQSRPAPTRSDTAIRLEVSPRSESATQTPLHRQSVHESPKFDIPSLRPRGLTRAIAENKAAAKQRRAQLLKSSAGPSKVLPNSFQTPLKPTYGRPSSTTSFEIIIPSPSPARSMVGSIKGKERAV